MDAQLQASAKVRALGYAACAAAGCIWSTGFYFGKIALAEMAVGHMVLYRFVFACLGLLPFAVRHSPGFNRHEWRVLMAGAFLGVPLQFLLQFYGLSLTTVSHAALMVGSMPVMLAAGATIFAKERLDWAGWLALLGSSAGVTLIVLSSRHAAAPAHASSSVSGDLLVLVSMLVATGWVLTNQRLMADHLPVVVTAYGLICGTAMLAPLVLLWNGLPPLHGVSIRAWLALAASGLLCTALTTLLWNWGIHRVPASRAGVFLNIEPMLGSVLGVVLMGDQLGPLSWVGGAMILAAAVTLTTRPHAHIAEVVLE